jgi:hypothetical protein
VDRNPQAPLYCRSELKYREGGGRLSFVIGAKPMAARGGVSVRTATGGMGSSGPAAAGGEVQIEDVVLVVSFPRSIRTVDLSSEVGAVNLDPRTNELTWTIGRLPRERAPELSGSLHFAPSAGAAAAGAPSGPPLEAVSAVLHFTVPNQTVSGLSVRDLQLVNEREWTARALARPPCSASNSLTVRCAFSARRLQVHEGRQERAQDRALPDPRLERGGGVRSGSRCTRNDRPAQDTRRDTARRGPRRARARGGLPTCPWPRRRPPSS